MQNFTFGKYSFVQNPSPDTGPDCYNDPTVCLPLSSNQNLKFFCGLNSLNQTALNQVFLELSGQDFGANFYAVVVPPDYDCTATPTYGVFLPFVTFLKASSWYISGQNAYAQFDVADNIDLDALAANDNIGAVGSSTHFAPAIGDCFKLLLVVDVILSDRDTQTDTTVYRQILGCTNCFVRINKDTCYTSVMTYSSPTDMFDFIYLIPDVYGTFRQIENSVELPMYLRDPIMNDDSKVYTRSDGSIIKLYERKEEQYTLETDLMPYTWLKALDIALSHDTVTIQNANASSFDYINTAQSFQKKDNFDIEYQKGPLTAFGKGTCKLLNANPVHLYNNNCS